MSAAKCCFTVALLLWPSYNLVAQSPHVSDSAGVRIIANGAPATPIHGGVQPAFTIGGDKAPAAQHFDRIFGGVRFSDGSVIVGESRKYSVNVLLLDSMGRIKSSVAGPARDESFEVAEVAPGPAGQALVWDGVHNTLGTYGANGREIALDRLGNPPWIEIPRGRARVFMRVAGELAHSEYVARVQAGPISEEPMHRDSSPVYIIERHHDPRQIATMFVGERFNINDAARHSQTGFAPWARVGAIAVLDSLWYTVDGSSFEIRGFDRAGHLRRLIRLDVPPIPVTPERLERAIAGRLRYVEPGERAGMTQALRGSYKPTRWPAYVDLHADAAGNLWAARGGIDGDETLWDEFSGSGRYRATYAGPPDLQVTDIGENGWVGLDRLYAEFPMLRVFRVTRPH